MYIELAGALLLTHPERSYTPGTESRVEESAWKYGIMLWMCSNPRMRYSTLLYPAKGDTAVRDLRAHILNQDIHYQVSDECKHTQPFLPRCLCASRVLLSAGLSLMSISSYIPREAGNFYHQAPSNSGTVCFFLCCTDCYLTVSQSRLLLIQLWQATERFLLWLRR